jgi:uncharacterized linocin/CFP29 family protein
MLPRDPRRAYRRVIRVGARAKEKAVRREDLMPLPTDSPPIMPGPPGGGMPGPSGGLNGGMYDGGLYNGPGAGQPILPVLDGMNLGREKLPEWTPAVWARIDAAAACEIDRSSVAAQFLPKVPSLTPSVRTVPANRIDEDRQSAALNIDQTNVLPLLEESRLFFLSKEQYYEEEAIGTAATLASRAANRLARDMDGAIFQGKQNQSLISVAAKQHTVPVSPLNASNPGVYGEKLFAAVTEAYGFLQGLSLYGPFALVLPPAQYADAHAPLATTLIMPADRIRALMTAGFYASGTLPANQGVMVSLGGTVDLAIAVHGATAFTLVESDETRRFRIYERFTVRIKVPESLVLLAFE